MLEWFRRIKVVLVDQIGAFWECVKRKKKRHKAVGIEGSPELQAMEEANCAVLSAHVVVGMATAIARMLVPRKAPNVHLMRFR